MSQSASFPEREAHHSLPVSVSFIVAVLFIAIFGIVVHTFQYRQALGEADLYRVLVGLMDGAVSGTRLSSALHYDRSFGFGYLAAFYAFVDPSLLRDPDLLMGLMNQVGFWSMLVGLLFFWCAVRLVHGASAATVAIIVFALSPMIPELATSGHQTIPMFSFLCAAATLLFLPLTGWRALLTATAGAVLLLIGLTMRGELFLALPWLVLSRVDTSSIRRLLISTSERSIAPASALIGFIVLQRYVQAGIGGTPMSSEVGGYFSEFYSWKTIVPGLVYMVVGCGFATVIAGAVAVAYFGRRILTARVPAGSLPGAEILGPMALVVVPLLFFLPNPAPTRHFILSLAGIGILIGVALANRCRSVVTAPLCIALGIGVANQGLSELFRPTLLRLSDADSPYLPVPTEYRTATQANLGWEWRRHATLVERRQRWNTFGDQLRSLCDDSVIVLSDGDAVEQLFSRLYAGGTPVEASGIEIKAESLPPKLPSAESLHLALVGQTSRGLPGLMGLTRRKRFIILDKRHYWPGDAVARIVADQIYADYKLVADPYSLSKFDKAAIPQGRKPRFGCSTW